MEWKSKTTKIHLSIIFLLFGRYFGIIVIFCSVWVIEINVIIRFFL